MKKLFCFLITSISILLINSYLYGEVAIKGVTFIDKKGEEHRVESGTTNFWDNLNDYKSDIWGEYGLQYFVYTPDHIKAVAIKGKQCTACVSPRSYIPLHTIASMEFLRPVFIKRSNKDKSYFSRVRINFIDSRKENYLLTNFLIYSIEGKVNLGSLGLGNYKTYVYPKDSEGCKIILPKRLKKEAPSGIDQKGIPAVLTDWAGMSYKVDEVFSIYSVKHKKYGWYTGQPYYSTYHLGSNLKFTKDKTELSLDFSKIDSITLLDDPDLKKIKIIDSLSIFDKFNNARVILNNGEKHILKYSGLSFVAKIGNEYIELGHGTIKNIVFNPPGQYLSNISTSLKNLSVKPYKVTLELKGANKKDKSYKKAKTVEVEKTREKLSPSSSGSKWAVIIGLSKYKHSGQSGLANLIFADDDAKAFARTLRNLGWSDSHVKSLVNEKATQRNILIALESWLTKAGSNDQIVLFWAGHGFPDPEDPEKVYFACYDTDIKIPATGYRMDRVRSTLEERKAKNVIVFADTCHAGKLITRGDRGVSIISSIEKMRREKKVPKGWIFMVGADTDRQAIEHTSWKNGAFTHLLIKGLSGEADGFQSAGANDSVVTLGELRAYMNTAMPDETQKVLGVAKRPVITTSTGDPDIWNLTLQAK